LSDGTVASISAESTTAISDSIFLINVGKRLPNYTAPRRTGLFERRKGKIWKMEVTKKEG